MDGKPFLGFGIDIWELATTNVPHFDPVADVRWSKRIAKIQVAVYAKVVWQARIKLFRQLSLGLRDRGKECHTSPQ
jgi:hypothetical protein